jgi:hypothetical protein
METFGHVDPIHPQNLRSGYDFQQYNLNMVSEELLCPKPKKPISRLLPYFQGVKEFGKP